MPEINHTVGYAFVADGDGGSPRLAHGGPRFALMIANFVGAR
jgi:hypothetical protein